MTPSVTLILSILSALPQEVAAITGAYNTVKSALAAPDQATIGAILTALDSKLDTDVTRLDQDLTRASSGG